MCCLKKDHESDSSRFKTPQAQILNTRKGYDNTAEDDERCTSDEGKLSLHRISLHVFYVVSWGYSVKGYLHLLYISPSEGDQHQTITLPSHEKGATLPRRRRTVLDSDDEDCMNVEGKSSLPVLLHFFYIV